MQPAPTITDSATHIPSATPLFPPSQAFLWLPDKPGLDIPFCSCDEVPRSPTARSGEPLHDGERYLSPPLPFHPIPINRFLTLDELQELAREVRRATGASPMKLNHPLDVLRNENKGYILVFLARKNLLSGGAPHGK